jgi:hypothetical protein
LNLFEHIDKHKVSQFVAAGHQFDTHPIEIVD